MTAVSDGPLSPELVLVSPELRKHALAEMPDPEWVAIVAQVRARTKVASRPLPQRRPRDRRARDVGMAALNLVFVAAVAVLTLTLSLIANASR